MFLTRCVLITNEVVQFSRQKAIGFRTGKLARVHAHDFVLDQSPNNKLAIKGYRSRCIPKVVGSNPTVARHIFPACPVWIYTQSNITQANQRNCLHFGLSQSECVKRLHHMIEICINVAIYIQIHYTYREFFQFCWYIKMGLIN